MLREKDVARHISSSWKVRLGLPVLFGVVALAVSTLRLPAQDAGRDQNTAAAPAAAPRTEFNRLYVPQDADGIVSFRPAEIIAQPEIKELLVQNGMELDLTIATLLSTFGISDAPKLPRIEEIEQISVGLHFGFHPEVPKGQTFAHFEWCHHSHNSSFRLEATCKFSA